ncbi:MAG TPA: VWA domain-containing protein [Chthonomonadaceae bacterium]|nr:VWA domain-containing protein [Chthonomonadaceae bacterium]
MAGNRPLEEAVEFYPYNPEPRCPCVLLLDTSDSMRGRPIQELNEGLRTFRDNLVRDPVASKRVDVALITFSSAVQVVREFVPITRFEPPQLTTSGYTHMGSGILEALKQLQSYKKALREMEMDYFRPHVFLITDGKPEGEDEEMVEQAMLRVQEEEAKKSVLFFAIGVEGADMARLSQIVVRPPIDLKGQSFRELIDYLSRSVSALSQSRFDSEEQRPLPPPGQGG